MISQFFRALTWLVAIAIGFFVVYGADDFSSLLPDKFNFLEHESVTNIIAPEVIEEVETVEVPQEVTEIEADSLPPQNDTVRIE